MDLAERLTPWELANLMHEAAFHRTLNIGALEQCMRRLRTRHGAPIMTKALELHLAGSAGTQSQLELRVLHRLTAAGVPEPQVNVVVPTLDGDVRVDLLWREYALCVEVDGVGHRRAATSRDDARRDSLLNAQGFQVMRVVSNDVDGGCRAVIRHIRSICSV